MTVRDEQSARLEAIVPWAELAGELRVALRPYEHGLHLRPSATGIRIVDLHPSRPQLDRGKLTARAGAIERLEHLMAAPAGAGAGRPTPEKELQSWLIADAYRHDGVMRGLSEQLVFVTDEQVFYDESGRNICDLLAVRLGADMATPVAIELKSKRELKRTVAQLETISRTVDRHLDGFSRVFRALLRSEFRLVGPCERWLIWPETRERVDPRAAELKVRRIVVRGYRAVGERYFIS